MARVIDLTGKLGIGERPAIIIDGERYEVNDSAKSMLQLLSIIGDGDVRPSDTLKVYELLFDAKTRRRIDALNLPFEGFVALIKAAVDIIGGDSEGEAATPATR